LLLILVVPVSERLAELLSAMITITNTITMKIRVTSERE
jgi:hypothetical protein